MNPHSTAMEIWEQHSDRLREFICKRLKHDERCEDILHDVFLKVVEKGERIKGIENPASYMIKMAQNSIIDHYRSLGKSALEEYIDIPAIKIETTPEYQLADCCLFFFIQKLPPQSMKAEVTLIKSE